MAAPRIGVYICHCGINIAGAVNMSEVTAYAARLPGVVMARNYTYMCSEPGQALIKNDILDLGINRVVVASCSPRMHEPTFRAAIHEAGLNPYCLEMANIREQCAWVHPGEGRAAALGQAITPTAKAMQLVSSAVAKARYLQPLEVRQVGVTPAALVIGGGIAGLQAALDIADAGFHAILVERQDHFGGHVARLNRTFPESKEHCILGPGWELVNRLVERIASHPNITPLLNAEVCQVDGYVGNFRIQVKQGEDKKEFQIGTIIVSTGFDVFEARGKPELGYGIYPQVITTLDFEKMAAGPIQIHGKEPRQVVFIQCVGSRDQALASQMAGSGAHPYCSRVCCMTTAKQARQVHERLPSAEITVFYMDVRAYGKGYEEFYDTARESGILYRRGNPSEILRRGERVVVRAEDTLLGELVEVEADLVVLAVGMTPRADSASLAGLLKLSRSADGFFMEAHPKLRPVETALAGIFLAGCCQGPKDIAETISQARAAAASAMIPLMRGRVQVEAMTAFVDEELCSGCGQCAKVCSFAALALNPRSGLMTVNAVLCQGCGACATACPSEAINVHQFTFDQIMAQVEVLASAKTY